MGKVYKQVIKFCLLSIDIYYWSSSSSVHEIVYFNRPGEGGHVTIPLMPGRPVSGFLTCMEVFKTVEISTYCWRPERARLWPNHFGAGQEKQPVGLSSKFPKMLELPRSTWLTEEDRILVITLPVVFRQCNDDRSSKTAFRQRCDKKWRRVN